MKRGDDGGGEFIPRNPSWWQVQYAYGSYVHGETSSITLLCCWLVSAAIT